MQAFQTSAPGKNNVYEIADVGMSAFSVFFTQSLSFLAHQRDIKLRKGRCNTEILFHLNELPNDNPIRNLLDPVSSAYVQPVYWDLFLALEGSDVLKKQPLIC